MANEITLSELRNMADRAGLNLSEDELQHLLPGVNRSRKQIAELRGLITDEVEPASAFRAQKEQAR